MGNYKIFLPQFEFIDIVLILTISSHIDIRHFQTFNKTDTQLEGNSLRITHENSLRKVE